MGEAKRRKQEEEAQERSFFQELISTLLYMAGVAVAVFLILHFVGQRTVVNGTSMCNTLQNGENLIMDKLSYRFHDPERFDIVIFPGPEENGEEPYFIKRVIGLPGETVQIKEDGKVYINDELLEEDVYGVTETISEPGDLAEPYKLAEDEYICLGDNRPVSYDSRYNKVGPVSRDEFTGKVWIRIWPLNKFGTVKNGNENKVSEEEAFSYH